MEEVRSGRQPFAKLDVLHRRNLERFLPRFGLQNLPDAVLHELTLAWHRLDAWPDVPAALARLKTKFLIAPVSNGNISLMVDLARRNQFAVGRDPRRRNRRRLQAEAAASISPPARRSIWRPAQCMMVAAHSKRSRGGGGMRACAPRTPRGRTSMGPNTGEPAPTVKVDFAAKDLAELADKLGV